MLGMTMQHCFVNTAAMPAEYLFSLYIPDNALCFCPGVEYSSRNVLTDPDIREGVKKFSEWPTIPQVYINGEFVGGSDILMGMHESGELKKVFLDEKA